MESNDSPEIPDRVETSDIPGLPSGVVLSKTGPVLLQSSTESRLTRTLRGKSDFATKFHGVTANKDSLYAGSPTLLQSFMLTNIR